METSGSPPAQVTRPRRVPVALRKRASRSCDLCKFRRRKCVPMNGTGSNCVGCTEQNLSCSFTAPRKSRFYGSLDDLSDRYRCLDALVKGIFPDQPVSTVRDLLALGQRCGVEMPEISAPARTRVGVETLVRSPKSHVTGFQDVPFGSASEQGTSTQGAASSEVATFRQDSDPPQLDRGPTMFRDQAGKQHYIGPSGTLNLLDRLQRVFLAHRSARAGTSGGTLLAQVESPETLEPVTPSSSTLAPPGGTTPQSGLASGSTPSQSDLETCLDKLPPSDVLEFLVHSYFRSAHGSLPLFVRSVLERELETYVTRPRRRKGPKKDQSLPDWGWLGCLYMILVFGSMSSPSLHTVDHTTFQQKYVAATRDLLPHLVTSCNLSSVRALLLLAFHLQNSCERNAAWNLTGVAVRISYAIGIHRQPVDSAASRECETLVLHSLYGFELFLASSLGRPSSLRGADIESATRRLPQSSGVNLDLRSSGLSLQLHMILSQANVQGAGRSLQRLYLWKRELSANSPQMDIPVIRLRGGTGGPVPFDCAVGDFDELEQKLASKGKPEIRLSLTLAMLYHYTGLWITRDALLQDMEHLWNSQAIISSQNSQLRTSGVFHIHQIIFCFLLLDSLDMVDGLSSLDVWYGYWAGMLLNLCCLPVHVSERPITLLGDGLGLAKHAVSEVHDAVQRVEKSATMKRLSSVLKTFVDIAQDMEVSRPLETAEAQESTDVVRREAGQLTLFGTDAQMQPAFEQMDWILDPWFPSLFTGVDGVGVEQVPNPFVDLGNDLTDARNSGVWTDVDS